MLVKTIRELSKKKYKIVLSSGENFSLYKTEINTYGLREEHEISPEIYDEIMNNVLPKRAKLYAMNLLKARPYTVRGLRDKVSEAEYPERIADIAVNYVSSYGYLDDQKYAEDFIYTYKGRKSTKRMRYELFQKGVSKEMIDKAFETGEAADVSECEEEQIRKFLQKKGYFDTEFTFDEKNKLKAALYRKGYDAGMIEQVIST